MRASIVFGGVCLSVSLSIENLKNYLVRIFTSSGDTFQMALPSNFVFGKVIHLQNIWVTVQFQGHGSKVKVTTVKKR